MFLHKIPGYFQGSRIQHKFQAFQGALGTLYDTTSDIGILLYMAKQIVLKLCTNILML